MRQHDGGPRVHRPGRGAGHPAPQPLEDPVRVVENRRLRTRPVDAFDQPRHVRATLVWLQSDGDVHDDHCRTVVLVDRDDPLDPEMPDRVHRNRNTRNFRMQVRQPFVVLVNCSPLRLAAINECQLAHTTRVGHLVDLIARRSHPVEHVRRLRARVGQVVCATSRRACGGDIHDRFGEVVDCYEVQRQRDRETCAKGDNL